MDESRYFLLDLFWWPRKSRWGQILFGSRNTLATHEVYRLWCIWDQSWGHHCNQKCQEPIYLDLNTKNGIDSKQIPDSIIVPVDRKYAALVKYGSRNARNTWSPLLCHWPLVPGPWKTCSGLCDKRPLRLTCQIPGSWWAFQWPRDTAASIPDKCPGLERAMHFFCRPWKQWTGFHRRLNEMSEMQNGSRGVWKLPWNLHCFILARAWSK
jgi:hypothetical protein